VPPQSQPAVPVEPAEPAVDPNSVQGLLLQADELVQANRKPQAYEMYRRALQLDAANTTALSWVEEFLRQRRKFADLRDVLLAASQVPAVSSDTRVAQLRDVAQICEQKLRDFDTAINAWKEVCQIDRGDGQAREHLVGLLQKQSRWDELAPLLEQAAMNEDDPEKKIEIEKKLATLHDEQRGDPIGAAEAWTRIAQLKDDDIEPKLTAVGLFDKGQQLERAAEVLTDGVASVDDKESKAVLLDKLADIRSRLADPGGAGDAWSEAGELLDDDAYFVKAVEAYQLAQRAADAAHVVERRAQLHEDGPEKAQLLSQAGQLMLSAGNPPAALSHFEAASALDPADDELATRVEEQYHQTGRHEEQVAFLLRRSEQISDLAMRVGVRHRAAAIQRSLGNEEGAKASLELVLSDGEDIGALQLLLDMADRAQDWQAAVDYLGRLIKETEGEDQLAYAVREAQLLADALSDVDGAISRYEYILEHIDEANHFALHTLADLEMRRSNHEGAAAALEKMLKIAEGDDRIEVARQLAQIYEGPLDDIDNAIRVLDIVHEGDEQDFDAISRLQRLAEKKEDWARVAELLAKLIEVEGDPEEASEMARQLARIHHEKLDKGQAALAVLEKHADAGDVACQTEYTNLGVELGWKGIVAHKLVQWNESVAGTSRAEALKRAFGLFVEVERFEDARTVVLELARAKECDLEMARHLEQIASELSDLDALAVAHDIIGKELSGVERAVEFVRQAEVMALGGADALDAIQHGEIALGGVSPDEVPALLARLAALTDAPGHIIDLYERQVQRCKKPQDRVGALAAAAQVAAQHGSVDRAREFFNSALSGGVNEDTLAALEEAARNADQAAGGDGKLLRTMAEALAEGGQGSRDGGRTRSALLRRAAMIAQRELHDVEVAFKWLGDSLIAHVDDAALEFLETLGAEVGDHGRIESALSRALEEVYDGPLVRKLLRRRADLRSGVLNDKQGAAADLKRLHDLSPADQKLTKELSRILTDLGDHRGMIELCEDQILRGREPHVRAELARKVARIWEEQIGDAREAADAWRRVLRMKAGDKEAQAGLERAKAGKLKIPPPVRGKASEATDGEPADAAAPPVAEAAVAEAAAAPVADAAVAPVADAAVADAAVADAAVADAAVADAAVADAVAADAAVVDAVVAPEGLLGTPDGQELDEITERAVATAQPTFDGEAEAYGHAEQPDAQAQPGHQPSQQSYEHSPQPPALPDYQSAGQVAYDPNQSAGQVAYDPHQPAGQVAYDPHQPAGQVAYDPNQPAGQVAYDPNQPAGQVAYDPNQPAGQVAYDPNQLAGQVAYDPNQPAGQVAYDPNQPDAYAQPPHEQQQAYYQQQYGQGQPDQADPNQQQAYQPQAYQASGEAAGPVDMDTSEEAIDLDASDSSVELIEEETSETGGQV